MLLKYVVGIIKICCWKIKVVSMLLLCMIICYWFAPNPNITILCYYVYLNLRFNGYKIILLTFCTSIKTLQLCKFMRNCGKHAGYWTAYFAAPWYYILLLLHLRDRNVQKLHPQFSPKLQWIDP